MTQREAFDGMEPAGPPEELRARVLDAAFDALGGPAPPDIWTRLYRSRLARAAWAASLALSLLGHVAISMNRPAAEAPRPAGLAALDPELAEVMSLPRLVVASHPLADLALEPDDEGAVQTAHQIKESAL